MRRTKIVCTIGPSSASPARIRELIRAGMDVARINFSHGDQETHRESIAAVRRVAREEGLPVSVLADLQGPKLRVGELDAPGLDIAVGDQVALVESSSGAVAGEIPVPHPELLAAIRNGEPILLDDGAIELVAVHASQDRCLCRVVDGGRLTSRKGINVPRTSLDLPSVTDKDRADVEFALAQGVDLIAISFVRRPADVVGLRGLIHRHGLDVPIVAKIEKPEALAEFPGILDASDAVMVARGDLGVETAAEEVPFHQKRIIRACNQAGKPVITATQMLQSMMQEPRPTRAEASDVANAILDGTDAVMLSGETAVGSYPVQSVETMARICVRADTHLAAGWGGSSGLALDDTITGAISRAAVEAADQVGARAIVTATESGTTARMVARNRPRVPVLAVTPNERTLHRLGLVWGVTPVLVQEFADTDQMVSEMEAAARRIGLANPGDSIVLTAGVPFGAHRLTNMVRVQRIG